MQCENWAPTGWQWGTRSTEQGSGDLDYEASKSWGWLKPWLFNSSMSLSSDNPASCLQGQGAHYPASTCIELLDVPSQIKQKLTFIEIPSIHPSTTLSCVLPSPDHVAKMWRQHSASSPSIPLFPGFFLGQMRQTPHLQRWVTQSTSAFLAVGHDDRHPSHLAGMWWGYNETAST